MSTESIPRNLELLYSASHSMLSKVGLKSASAINTIVSSVFNGISSAYQTTTIYSLKKGSSLIRASLINKDFSQMKDECYETLNQISHSEELSQLIKEIYPLIGNYLIEFVSQSISEKPILSTLFVKEKYSIEDYIEALFLKCITNLFTHLNGIILENGMPNDSHSDFIASSAEYLFGLLNSYLKREGDEHAITTSVKEFLKIIFPNGQKDFELNNGYLYSKLITPTLWKKITEEFIPSFFTQFYQFCTQPQYHNREEHEFIFQVDHGLIHQIILILSNQMAEAIPNLLSDQCEKEIFKSDHLNGWTSQILFMIIPKNFTKFPELSARLEEHLYSWLIHCFYNQMKNLNLTEGQLISKELLQNLVSDINIFFRNGMTPSNFESFSNKICNFLFIDKASIKNNISLFLKKIYRDTAASAINEEDYLIRMIHLCYNPLIVFSLATDPTSDEMKNFFKYIALEDKNNRTHNEHLWKISGARKYAEEIVTICHALAANIVISLRQQMRFKKASIFNFFNQFLFQNKFNQEHLAQIQRLISHISEKEKDKLENLFYLLERQLGLFFLKIGVNIAECQGGSFKERDKIPTHLIFEFLQIIENTLYRLNECGEDESLISEALIPMSGQVIEKIFPFFEKELPIPSFLKNRVRKVIEHKILPSIFGTFFYHAIKILNDRENNKIKLQQTFNTTYPAEACRVTGLFVEQFLPYFFYRYDESIIDSIYNYIFYYFEKQSQKVGVESILQFLCNNQNLIKSIVKKNINYFLNSEKNKKLQEFSWHGLGTIVEAISLVLFVQIGEKIEYIEKIENNIRDDFLLHLCILILQVVTEHFLTLNRIKKDKNKSEAYMLSSREIIEGFGYGLHKATNLSNSIPEEIKDRIRLEHFFNDFIYKISGCFKKSICNAKYQFLVNPFIKIVNEELLPRVALEIFKLGTNPCSLDQLLIYSLELFNDSVESFSINEDCYDEQQKVLNQTCGEFVLELGKLFPQTFTKTIFKLDKVKKMTAEKIGLSIRKKISKTSLKGMINKALCSGVLLMHLGRFEGEPRREVFIPLRKRIGPRKETVFEPSLFDMNFPKNSQAIEIYELMKKNTAKMAKKKLEKEMIKTIINEIENAILEFFNSQWSKLQEFLKAMIGKLFGSCGKKVKKILDLICNFLFFTVVLSIFKIIMYPFYKLGLAFLRMHISQKSKKIIKDYHMRIHENCFYKITTVIFEFMQNRFHERFRTCLLS